MMLDEQLDPGVVAWLDPRIAAGKTNTLAHPTVYAPTVNPNSILVVGPDGLANTGRRFTATGNGQNMYWDAPYTQWPNYSAVTRAFGMYVRTSGDIQCRMLMGDTGAGYQSGTDIMIGNYPEWTLVEGQWANGGAKGMWVGVYGGWSTGEWIEMAYPMTYLGNKVT